VKARKLLAVPLFAAVLLTGACNVGKNADVPTGQKSVGEATSQSINAQPRDSLVQGGELRLPAVELGSQWNPAQINGNDATLAQVRSPLSPSYFTVDGKGNFTFDKNYLTQEPTATGNPLVVTYELNPKAIWNDGSPINAEDFIQTWKSENGSNKAYQIISSQGMDQITSVKAGKDKFEVIMTYKSTYADWKLVFSSVQKAASIKDPAVFNKGWISNLDKITDWFSGPFIVTNYNKTQGSVTEEPNPNWWGDKPLLKKISFKHAEADGQAGAFVNGEIDSFDVGVNADAYQRAQTAPNSELRKAAGPNWRHITVNNTAGLLKDEKLRQVIVEGLDRRQVAESDLAGLDWPAEPLNNNIFLSNQTGYVDMAKQTGLDFNQDKAKSDLDAMGWKVPAGSTDGIREKDGKKLTIKFSQLVGIKVSENEATQLQNQMKGVGINIQIVNQDTATYGEALSAGKFETIAFTWLGTPSPFQGIQQLYGTGSNSNYGKMTNPDVDKLVDPIANELDTQKRIDMANQAAAAIWTTVDTIPLYQRPDISACVKKLANFGAFGIGSVTWTDVGFMK